MISLAISILWLLIGIICLAGVIWLVLYGIKTFVTPIPARFGAGHLVYRAVAVRDWGVDHSGWRHVSWASTPLINNLNELPVTTPVMALLILIVVAIAIGLEQLTAWLWPPSLLLRCCC